MRDVRRINLCFDMEKIEHQQVYSIILSKSAKTDFVVECVLTFMMKDCIISKEMLVDTIKQVLIQMDWGLREDALHYEEMKDKGQIPDSVFEIIESL